MARVRVQTPSSAIRTKSISPKFEDSPSRQLMLDLERALSQARIHEVELQKVHYHDRRLFQETLDQLDTRRAEEDVAALDAATSKHETVRKEAEAELQQYYRDVEEQERLKRQQEEERRAKEQQAREKAEAERKTRQEGERRKKLEMEQAAARKAAEEKAKAEEAIRRKQEDDAAREKTKKERKQRHEQENERAKQHAAEEKAAQESAPQTTTPSEQPSVSQGQASTVASVETGAQHQRYLQIHQHLKTFRREFWAQCKKDTDLKSKVGDMRRAIKTSVGQLTEAKGANKLPVRPLCWVLHHMG
jgi:nucleoporin GLE1